MKLENLKKKHIEKFARLTYLVLLNRPIETDGEKYYTEKLLPESNYRCMIVDIFNSKEFKIKNGKLVPGSKNSTIHQKLNTTYDDLANLTPHARRIYNALTNAISNSKNKPSS